MKNKNIDFQKGDGLLPAVIQDAGTGRILMLGYMNEFAYQQTLATRKVTFFSRSKQRLWVKGETSGHYLLLEDMRQDCDGDALLIKAIPTGTVCHTGSDTCWGEDNKPYFGFLSHLEGIIKQRQNAGAENSYVSALFQKGINRIVQKVGEEAIEVVIEAKDDHRKLFLEETADLLFHLLILLRAKDCRLEEVVRILEKRDKRGNRSPA